MIVVTLARKPLVGTVAQNVLKWGSGGLNIDACRIGDTLLKLRTTGARTMRDLQCGWGFRSDPYRAAHYGRHPPNLVILHKNGCLLIGTKQVPATARDAPGPETVPSWACKPGCPALILDQCGKGCIDKVSHFFYQVQP